MASLLQYVGTTFNLAPNLSGVANVVNLPAGTQPGDIVIAWVLLDGTTGTVTAWTQTPNLGGVQWTPFQVFPGASIFGASDKPIFAYSECIQPATNPGNYTLTWTGANCFFPIIGLTVYRNYARFQAVIHNDNLGSTISNRTTDTVVGLTGTNNVGAVANGIPLIYFLCGIGNSLTNLPATATLAGGPNIREALVRDSGGHGTSIAIVDENWASAAAFPARDTVWTWNFSSNSYALMTIRFEPVAAPLIGVNDGVGGSLPAWANMHWA